MPRQRELERDKIRAALVDATPEEVRRGITEQRCPFCKMQRQFRVLANHTESMHGVDGYTLREMAGLNRGTSICDPLVSAARVEWAKERVTENRNFLAFDRSTIAGIRETEERPEGREHRLEAANRPERKEAFRRVLARVDRKAVEARVPLELKQKRGRAGAKALRRKYGLEKLQESMRQAREQRTPESELRRVSHAQDTMREQYWNDPEYRARWREAVTAGAQKRRKVSIEAEAVIFKRVTAGESYRVLAEEYGVSRSAIWLICKRGKEQQEGKGGEGQNDVPDRRPDALDDDIGVGVAQVGGDTVQPGRGCCGDDVQERG